MGHAVYVDGLVEGGAGRGGRGEVRRTQLGQEDKSARG